MFDFAKFLRRTIVLATLPLAACMTGAGWDYTPLVFKADGDRIVANGVIDGSSPAAFKAAISAQPGAKTLVLTNVPGSADDDANLILARMVRNSGLSTEVPGGGMVASGGTDLFLAGVTRRTADDACLGVHSWSGGGPFTTVTPADFPRDHEEHQKYLRYYREMNIPEDFYWYTLEAATADDMHWMTAEEANRFQVTTAPVSNLGRAGVCDARP